MRYDYQFLTNGFIKNLTFLDGDIKVSVYIYTLSEYVFGGKCQKIIRHLYL